MDIYRTVIDFFTGFSLVAAVFILTGLMSVIIEMFRSSKKPVFGLTGGVLIFAGIVIRMLNGGSVATLFFILFFVGFILTAVHLFILRFQKRQWLYQSLRLALTARHGDVTGDTYGNEFLVGKAGTAATDIDGEGNAALDGVTVLVHSERFIERGAKVRVVSVERGKVFVEAAEV